MSEVKLRYGMNPHQAPARAFAGGALPFAVLNGAPGFINLLDALNGWQLVRELRAATGLPAAASFKHVSPSGAAVGTPLDETQRAAYFTGRDELTPLAAAYARARGTDRLASFGDFVALSDPVDERTARLIRQEVSDGVIAPGYDPEALRLLSGKRDGTYLVLRADPAYEPPAIEARTIFGVTLEQRRNDARIEPSSLAKVVTARTDLPPAAVRDLQLALITLKYTQSNSVCLTRDGQTIGVGAGQQSRVDCVRLAASKAERWWLRQHPRTLGLRFRDRIARPDRDNAVDAFIRGNLSLLGAGAKTVFADSPAPLTAEERAAWLARLDGASLGSDAFFPFEDSIAEAARVGVRYIAQPGGSQRDAAVAAECDTRGIAMAITGTRLFHH